MHSAAGHLQNVRPPAPHPHPRQLNLIRLALTLSIPCHSIQQMREDSVHCCTSFGDECANASMKLDCSGRNRQRPKEGHPKGCAEAQGGKGVSELSERAIFPKMFPLASGMAVSAEAAHAATTAEAECWPWARLPAMGIHHTLSVRSQQQAIVDGPRGRPQWHLEHTSGPKQQLLEPPAYDNPAYENLLAMYHCVKLSSHCCTG